MFCRINAIKCVFQKFRGLQVHGVTAIFPSSNLYLMIKCWKMIICHMVMLMIWVCHMHHHNFWQISQFAKNIHNSSPISLASLCWLLCYPSQDRCESEAIWDPDGTFPTIRFGLPLENDPFPVCDTNVSLSANNEMTPAMTFSFCHHYFILVSTKRKRFTLVVCESYNKSHAHFFVVMSQSLTKRHFCVPCAIYQIIIVALHKYNERVFWFLWD